MRPIDGDALAGVIADAARRLIDDGYSPQGDALRETAAFIKEFPAIEAEPVRHWYWIETNEGTFCSECDKTPIEVGPYHICNYSAPYCPNCGAKMDAGGA